jgi:hypothetical protein
MTIRNRYVAAEPDICTKKQTCGWRARYMALRNRYVAGEPDIWPSETDMWLESQI